jgi:radical SAM protein with 4Fe4S-binding SPASM domain
MMINADGTVNPCCYDYHSDWVIGSLAHETVGDIWSGERFTALRQQIHDDITQIPICRTCSVAALIAEQRARG